MEWVRPYKELSQAEQMLALRSNLGDDPHGVYHPLSDKPDYRGLIASDILNRSLTASLNFCGSDGTVLSFGQTRGLAGIEFVRVRHPRLGIGGHKWDECHERCMMVDVDSIGAFKGSLAAMA